ncbi:MAG TPA: 2-dehydropantoate 2-reductase, partial [Chloroflexota bacterium]|nr:2-dehydropantoate 2-reductase [Chloroflexota bacterium]
RPSRRSSRSAGMKFAIVGAGATGGFLGARLARAGEDVTLIARGAHLAAMRSGGVRVISSAEEFVAHPTCTDDLGAAGQADVVVLTVKAHSLAPIAPALRESLGPETVVITAQNGIPWWYFYKEGGRLEGTRLHTVDPDGVLFESFEANRIVGCVVWPATRLVAPGVVEHVEGTRFTLGELDGSKSERCRAIAAALIKAGLKSPISAQIRREIWLKLLGNVAFNPLSALTRATLVEIASHPDTRAVARAMMEEADSVARALGIQLEIGIDQRLAGAEKVGEHKTSMLQDVESGRPLEVEALVGAPVEIGQLLGLPLPHLQTIYACTKLLDETLRNPPAR